MSREWPLKGSEGLRSYSSSIATQTLHNDHNNELIVLVYMQGILRERESFFLAVHLHKEKHTKL